MVIRRFLLIIKNNASVTIAHCELYAYDTHGSMFRSEFVPV
jgi:hypothetical protein